MVGKTYGNFMILTGNFSILDLTTLLTSLPCRSSPDSRDAELAAELWRRSEEILEMNVEGLMLMDEDDKESVFGISPRGDTVYVTQM